MVCPPAWRRRCIGGLCSFCIVCAGMGKINGKAAAKPCKWFWLCGSILNCMDGKKAAVNVCVWLIRRRAKEKPRQRGRGRNYLFFSSRSARAAQSSCVSSSVKSYSVQSWSASALLHPPSYRAAALLETSFNMAFSSFPGFYPFSQYIISQAPLTGLARNIFALLGWGGVALRCSPAKLSDRHYLLALNSALKNQKKNRSADSITVCTPFIPR